MKKYKAHEVQYANGFTTHRKPLTQRQWVSLLNRAAVTGGRARTARQRKKKLKALIQLLHCMPTFTGELADCFEALAGAARATATAMVKFAKTTNEELAS